MAAYRRCALEHHYAYELGYRALGEVETLRMGSLFHRGLEAWWLAFATPERRLEAALDAMRPHAADDYDFARASVLMRGYDARWGDDDALEVLAVEAEFRAPLINPLTGAASRTFQLAGKLDVIVRRRDDRRVYIMEHKTSGEDITAGSAYWQRLTLDSQISTYFAGGRALGHEIAGCIYDVIGKPRHAPKLATPVEDRKYTKAGVLYANQRDTDETPDEYEARLEAVIAEAPDRWYQRGTVVRLPEEERDAAYDAWQTARLIREAAAARAWPRTVASCERYGRLCGFFAVCTRTAALEDFTAYQQLGWVHPELTPHFDEADAAEE